MTSTELFYNNTLTALRFFETRLAPESHIILVGLIDASFLWTNMANRYHPLVRRRDEFRQFTDCDICRDCTGKISSIKTCTAGSTVWRLDPVLAG